MLRPSFLEYGDHKFLKLSSLLGLFAILLYWAAWPEDGRPYGGTWLGYALGITSASILLLLAWYGIRKRQTPKVFERRKHNRRRKFYRDNSKAARARSADRRRLPAEEHWRFGNNLQAWLSSHVYLGMLLILLASLHAGFHFNWNLHTLTYFLLVVVVASGIYGLYAYLRYPRLITENLGEDTLEDLLLQIVELDEMARVRALDLPNDVNFLVTRSRKKTRLGHSWLQRLMISRSRCPTDHAVKEIERLGKVYVKGDQTRLMRDLYTALLQKQRLVKRARQDIRLNARMRFWLMLHGPLSIALLAALFAHVLSVLIYW
jgi:hypothetical protein